jgi:GH24 family phage-related lysozyme (muramidase)
MAGLQKDVQIVLVDMAFNAGMGALSRPNRFQHFRELINRRDYAAAAAHVRAGGLGMSRQERNDARADRLLLAAASVEASGVPENPY